MLDVLTRVIALDGNANENLVPVRRYGHLDPAFFVKASAQNIRVLARDRYGKHLRPVLIARYRVGPEALRENLQGFLRKRMAARAHRRPVMPGLKVDCRGNCQPRL